jgi:hypothetical protein
MLLELPESVEGNGPTLATLVSIGRILESSQDEGPISLAEVARRMSAKRVRHATIRASVDFLKQLGFVTEGSKGVLWTLNRDRKLWSTARRARRL